MRRTAAIAMVLGCGPVEDDPTPADESGSSTTGSVTSAPSTSNGSGSSASPSTSSASSETTQSGDSDETSSDDSGSSTTAPIELDCEGSVLADVVADMPARSWRELPENESLTALDMHYSLLYYNDSAVWDPARRRLQWIGGPGTCCANPAQYRLMAYDELTDLWTIEDAPFEGTGHGYDGNALDPSTGLHYFAKYMDPVVQTFDGEAWGTLPPIPFYADAASGLTWFEELGGPVYIGQYGLAAWYDGTAWTELTGALEEPWGSIHTFAEYTARHEIAWVGGGNNADRVNYVIDATGSMTRGTDAPVTLNVNQSVKSVDPVSGNFIVGLWREGQWWEYAPLTDTWTELVDMIDLPDMHSYALFHVPLAHCGVTLFFGHFYENRHAWLYRHSPV